MRGTINYVLKNTFSNLQFGKWLGARPRTIFECHSYHRDILIMKISLYMYVYGYPGSTAPPTSRSSPRSAPQNLPGYYYVHVYIYLHEGPRWRTTVADHGGEAREPSLSRPVGGGRKCEQNGKVPWEADETVLMTTTLQPSCCIKLLMAIPAAAPLTTALVACILLSLALLLLTVRLVGCGVVFAMML